MLRYQINALLQTNLGKYSKGFPLNIYKKFHYREHEDLLSL